MPSFSLASIPGIEGTFLIAENAAGVPVDISLKDAVLFLPGQTKLPLTASHQRENDLHVVTLQGNFAPAQTLLAGQLSLTQLTLTLRYRPGVASADTSFDRTVQNAVTAIGTIEWTGAAALEFANPVRFSIGYTLAQNAPSGFTLTLLDTPLNLPGNLARIDSGQLGVELPFDRPVFAIVLEGQAALTGTGADAANQLLQTIFQQAGPIQPAGFRIRQEFGLTNGSIPAVPVPSGVPSFTINCGWGGNAPPLADPLPQAMKIDIGPPSFTLPLGGLLPSFKLKLPQSRIEFPDIEAFRGLRIAGNFDLETGAASRLLFQPDMSGGFELPPVLSSLFDRFRWGGPVAVPDLLATASRSVAEADWLGMFRSLLPPVPTSFNPAQLSNQLFTLLSEALGTAGLEAERIFGLALKGLAAGGRDAYKIAWENWLSPALAIPNAELKLPSIVLGMGSLADNTFRDAMTGLLAVPNAAEQLVSGFFAEWVGKPDLDFDRYQQAWARTLALLLPDISVPALDKLTGGMLDAISLPAFQPIRAGGLNAFAGMEAPRLPAGELMLASTMYALAAPSRFNLPNIALKALGKMWDSFWRQSPGPTEKESRERREHLLRVATNAANGAEVLLSLVISAVKGNANPWWSLFAETINEDTPEQKQKVKTFGAGKYLIISDVHRDCAADRPQPFDAKGGISHFSKNEKLFLSILEWADTPDDDGERYTVLEAGDCEELWYIRDPDTLNTPDPDTHRTGVPKILTEILRTHPAVYAKMRSMWRAGRYHRLYGNHDSFLRDADVFAVLQEEMEKEGLRPDGSKFVIHDFFVLKQVKRMTEHGMLEKFFDYWDNPDELQKILFTGTLGLDSNDYHDLCPMVIAHGHQFDFWNCDANNLLGLYLSQIGVKVDKAIDSILDARGIAIGGNVVVDFGDVLAEVPIADCWPARGTAVRLAHEVQHLSNSDRGLVDDLFYKESVAAFVGTFGIATDHFDANGNRTKPEQTWGIGVFPQNLLDYLEKHHDHHICLGHTHNPHSQPFFTIQNLADRIPLMGGVWRAIETIATRIPVLGRLFPRNLIKSKYFNSGTSGWMEGVVWAIEVDVTKQARLVFWTDNSKGPEYMDWELHPLDPAVKAKMPQNVGQVIQTLENVLAHIIGIPLQFLKTIGALLSIPFELLNKVIQLGAQLPSTFKGMFREVVKTAPEQLEAVLEQMQGHHLALLLTLKARLMGKRPASPDEFTFEIDISEEIRARLKNLRDAVRQIDATLNEFAALHVACIADPVIGTKLMPRTAPFYGKLRESLDGMQTLPYDAPVLSVFSSFVSLFPADGLQTDIGNATLRSKLRFAQNDERLQLVVTISENPGAPPIV